MEDKKDHSDDELMGAYQNGDEAAFIILFKRHSSRVYGFLINRLKNRNDADDVFQATFLKLHKARRHYDPTFPFVPWLFTVCKSVLADHARKQARVRMDLGHRAPLSLAIEKTNAELYPPSFIDLKVLRANQRAAVEMRYFEELPFAEIAHRLETTPQNARKLISRGIQKLKKLNLREGKPV